MRNKVNKIGKNLKRDYFTKKIAPYKGNLKEKWKTVNLLLNKRSKTTNISSLDVEGRNVTDNNEIAQSMNEFFCSVGKKLSDDIPQQPNPLLSNEYNINEEGTSFQFKTVCSESVEKALKKMKPHSALDHMVLQAISSKLNFQLSHILYIGSITCQLNQEYFLIAGK